MTRREVGVAALIALGTVAWPVRAVAAPRTRSIHLEITLPNGAITGVIVRDGEGVSAHLKPRKSGPASSQQSSFLFF